MTATPWPGTPKRGAPCPTPRTSCSPLPTVCGPAVMVLATWRGVARWLTCVVTAAGLVATTSGGDAGSAGPPGDARSGSLIPRGGRPPPAVPVESSPRQRRPGQSSRPSFGSPWPRRWSVRGGRSRRWRRQAARNGRQQNPQPMPVSRSRHEGHPGFQPIPAVKLVAATYWLAGWGACEWHWCMTRSRRCGRRQVSRWSPCCCSGLTSGRASRSAHSPSTSPSAQRSSLCWSSLRETRRRSAPDLPQTSRVSAGGGRRPTASP